MKKIELPAYYTVKYALIIDESLVRVLRPTPGGSILTYKLSEARRGSVNMEEFTKDAQFIRELAFERKERAIANQKADLEEKMKAWGMKV